MHSSKDPIAGLNGTEPSNCSILQNNRGATMLEFALIIGLILTLILVIVDGSRYFLLQNTLTRAAERAVNVAKKDIRLTYDLRPESSPDEATIAAYRAAQKDILDIALSLSGLVSAESDSDTKQKLMPYRMPNPRFGLSPGALPITADAALILPGQTVEYKLLEGGDAEHWRPVTHPTCPATVPCAELGLPGAYGWQQLMLTHPIVVEVRSTLPIYSFLGRNMEVLGRAVAWQERVPISMQAAPFPQPTPTPEPPPPPPEPPRCSDITDANEACQNKCLDEHQECVFHPNNLPPNCVSCEQLTCSQWTNEEDWCETKQCADYQECLFNPDAKGTNCGSCRNGLCKDWKGEEEYCGELNCEEKGLKCEYLPNATAPQCGGCVPKLCHEATTEEASCAELQCGETNEHQTCDFFPYNNSPDCAKCRTLKCHESTSGEQACAELKCEERETPSTCEYFPQNDAPQCAGCRTLKCSEWKSESEACEAQSCGEQGWEYVCNYQPHANAPGCVSCQRTTCSQLISVAEACELADCESKGPEWKCQFQGNTKPTSPAGCAACVKKTCKEMTTKEQFCSDKNCENSQDCNFNPNGLWPDCGDGQCYDLSCKTWTNKSEQCAGACAEDEVCEFLPNGKGTNCHTCRPKTCADLISKKQACQAIGCDESLNTCIYNPTSTDLNSCTATCEPKPCSALTKAQACNGTVCSAWETCTINPAGEQPNCSQCVDVPCSQWTNRESVCAACLNDPMQTCEWNPGGYGQACGGCLPVPICEPQACPAREIWLPHPVCKCQGGN